MDVVDVVDVDVEAMFMCSLFGIGKWDDASRKHKNKNKRERHTIGDGVCQQVHADAVQSVLDLSVMDLAKYVLR